MGSEEARTPFERVELAMLQLGWLGQRQFMQLLAEERFGLTVPQFYTLLHLSLWQGECKMSNLARATHQSAASLTGVIDRLLDKQLVQRERPEGDRRQVMVYVTERGHVLLKEIKYVRSQAVRSACGDMSVSDADVFLRLLERICAGMTREIEGRGNLHETR